MSWFDTLLDWGAKAYTAVNDFAPGAASAVAGGVGNMALAHLNGEGGENNLQRFGAGAAAGYAADRAMNYFDGSNGLSSNGPSYTNAGLSPPVAQGQQLAGTVNAGPTDYSSFGGTALPTAPSAGGAVLSGTGGTDTDFSTRLSAGLQNGVKRMGNNLIDNLPGTAVKLATTLAGSGGQQKRIDAYNSGAAGDMAVRDKQNVLADRVAGSAEDAGSIANRAFARTLNAGAKQSQDTIRNAMDRGVTGDALEKLKRSMNMAGASNAQTQYTAGLDLGNGRYASTLGTASGMYKGTPQSTYDAANVEADSRANDLKGWGAMGESLLGSARNQAKDDTN